jgi:putative endopeptidase
MRFFRLLGFVPGLLLAVAASAATLPSGINRAYMDTTCAPCKDFFQYANGAWIATAEIPGSYSSIGVGREMTDRNQEALRATLEDAAKDWKTQKDPDVRKLGALYAGLMDSLRADREGAARALPHRDRCGEVARRSRHPARQATRQG